MLHTIFTPLAVMAHWFSRYKKLLLGVAGVLIFVLVGFVVLSYLLIAPYDKYILNPVDKASVAQTGTKVGIVLGAGITKQGKPFRELQARLDVAADAVRQGYVDKLVLSGDNRFKKYDEPGAMKRYLVTVQHIPASKLQVDDAGRSTYESCERASKIFELHRAIIFSATSHLPRAIYLCRHFGVAAYGISSHVEANNSGRREILARAKAVFNLYIHGEDTVLGKPIPISD